MTIPASRSLIPTSATVGTAGRLAISLQGDCYAFRITDEKGEEIDGCGGFFGDDISEVLRDMRDNVSIEFDGLFKKMEHHSSAYAAMM